jgi:hypothetical protein
MVQDIWILTPALVEVRHAVSDDAKIVVIPSGDVGLSSQIFADHPKR